MRLLVLGGTLFLGRHVVDAALARGHDVTLFHRGRTNPGLFPRLEHVHGDRARDLAVLSGRRWDAVVDTCGYTPPSVRASAERLRDSVDHYTFISSISVYEQPTVAGTDETARVSELPRGVRDDEFAGEHYGALKVLCERVVEQSFAERSLMVRAGLLVGPYDPTDRFTYWVQRFVEGGEILAPGRPERRLQFIDGRDLAGWIVAAIEARRSGVFNVTGPAAPIDMGGLMAAMETVARAKATVEWVPEEFLLQHQVAPWSDLPLWLPESMNPLLEMSIDRARATGFVCRPLEETIRDTRDWFIGEEGSRPVTAGLSRARETEVLQAWRTRTSG